MRVSNQIPSRLAAAGGRSPSRRDLLRFGAAGLALGVGLSLHDEPVLAGGWPDAAAPTKGPLADGVPDMPIIDAHTHLWDSNTLRLSWIDGLPAINRPWLPTDYLDHNTGIRLGGIVYVETGVEPAYKTLESRWLMAQAADNGWIQGAVLFAPLEFGDRARFFLDDLKSLGPIVKGIRRGIGGDGGKIVDDPNFVRGVRMLSDYGWTFDILAKGDAEGAAAIRLVKSSPGTSFMLDHLLKPAIKAQVLDPWRAQMSELAQFPNVSIKLSGMVTEADLENWKPADLAPYIDHAISAFGEDRIVFGGDWPVVNLASNHLTWVQTLNALTPQLSPEGKRKLFADNARRFYGLPPTRA